MIPMANDDAWQPLGYNIWRAAIPGGWLVGCFNGMTASDLTFVPDPQHMWNGLSIPLVYRQEAPASDDSAE